MLKMNGIEATKAVCINPSTLKKCAPVLEGRYMKSSTKRFWYWRSCLRLVHGCQKVWCNYGERLFAAEKLRKSLIGAGADTGNRFPVWKSKRGSIYILKRTVIKKKRPSWPKKLEWELWIYDTVYSWFGSQQHYMRAIPENKFGLAVARVLKNERKTTRPVKNLLVVFNRQRSDCFWSLGVIYITLTILRQRGQTGVLWLRLVHSQLFRIY